MGVQCTNKGPAVFNCVHVLVSWKQAQTERNTQGVKGLRNILLLQHLFGSISAPTTQKLWAIGYFILL